jgi:hypothetical protein
VAHPLLSVRLRHAHNRAGRTRIRVVRGVSNERRQQDWNSLQVLGGLHEGAESEPRQAFPFVFRDLRSAFAKGKHSNGGLSVQ